MSIKLKLTGLKTFTGRGIGEAIVKRGEVIEVDDELGERLRNKQRTTLGETEEPIPYFTEVGSDAKVDHDMTGVPAHAKLSPKAPQTATAAQTEEAPANTQMASAPTAPRRRGGNQRNAG